jgi:xanthine dehydrogenase YagR molybdenum-binding subunit
MTIGTSLTRPDGWMKLTGAANYAADHVLPDMVYAVLVTATVPRGRVTELHTAQAAGAPGVVAVLTRAEMPRLVAPPVPPLAHSVIPMQDDTIHYEGQPIALVAAATHEQAEHAAGLVRACYTDVGPAAVFGGADVVVPFGPYQLAAADLQIGDVDAGLAQADVVVHETYRTADRHHNPIEPSATLAS